MNEQTPLLITNNNNNNNKSSFHFSDKKKKDEHLLNEALESEKIQNIDEIDPLEKKKKELNTLFGFRPWATHISKKPHKTHTEIYETVPVQVEKPQTTHLFENFLLIFGNIIWVIFFGWWISLIYIIVSGILYLSISGSPYGKLCWQLKSYFFWPFGKYIVTSLKQINATSHLLSSGDEQNTRKFGHFIWLFCLFIFLLPTHLLCYCITWFFVVSIPMAKINFQTLKLLLTTPLTLHIENNYPGPSSMIKLCTHQAFNIYYFKYTVKGINIVFLNLIPIVFLGIIESFVPGEYGISPIIKFFLDLACTIPVTFFIGMAISSIAAQTNYMIGAILNASFGSMTELILYSSAIRQGGLDELVKFSVTGGLLSDMLLLPGLSMILGGLKYKEQKFNPVAAGVGSILLFISVIGAFTPTIFYHTYGNYFQHCFNCTLNNSVLWCFDCKISQDMITDPMYKNAARPLAYFTAALLPIAYFIGLLFTFRTHRHIFEKDKEEEENEAIPEWSILFSCFVLLVSTLMFGLIAESLVHQIKPTLETIGIHQSFLGLTLIALVPAATELANAIKFALQNNISLSVEIGSASAIQIALIQIPFLVIVSAIIKNGETEGSFILIFPLLSVFAVIFAVITFNYISSEGKTNYFVGASMVMIYALLVASFFFIPEDSNNIKQFFNEKIIQTLSTKHFSINN